MSVQNYDELYVHVGHVVEVVAYSDVNVAIECVECSEILTDFDKE